MHNARISIDLDKRLAPYQDTDGLIINRTGVRVIPAKDADEGSSFTSEEDIDTVDNDAVIDLMCSQELELEVLFPERLSLKVKLQ